MSKLYISVATSSDLDSERSSGTLLCDNSFMLPLICFDTASSEWTELPIALGPRFWVAPDGHRDIFHYDGALWLHDGAGPERCLHVLPNSSIFVSDAAWSPDGERFVASYAPSVFDDPPRAQTFLMRISTGQAVRLPIMGTFRVRDWSRDGKYLLVAEKKTSRSPRQICLIRPDGTGIRRLATEAGCNVFQFLPDGSGVVSTRGPRPSCPEPSERGAVWVMDCDGKNDRMIFGNAMMCCHYVKCDPHGDRFACMGFYRYPETTEYGRAGDLDLGRPFVMIFEPKHSRIRQIQPPRPFHIVRHSSIDWRS